MRVRVSSVAWREGFCFVDFCDEDEVGVLRGSVSKKWLLNVNILKILFILVPKFI